MHFVIVFLLASVVAGMAGAASYTVTDLQGGLAGPSFTPVSLNNRGQVAGTVTGSLGSRAVFWDPVAGASVLDILPAGYVASHAIDINDCGQMLGQLQGAAGTITPFLWDAVGGYSLLASAPSGPVFSPADLNGAGQVVGTAFGAGASQAFLWDPAQGLSFLPATAGPSRGLAINDSGQVLARDGSQFLIWTAGGGVTPLGDLVVPEGIASFGIDLNDAGMILGATAYTSEVSAPFLWDPAHGLRGLGFYPGSTDTWPAAMNDLGQVVGIAGSFGRGCCTPFLWDPVTGYHDLNALVGAGAGGRIDNVVAINDRGQILGQVWTGSGLSPVLLSPVEAPLPAAALALAGALAGLGAVRAAGRRAFT